MGTAITSIVLHRLLYRWPCVPRINRRFSLSFDGYLLIICATVMVERWPSEPYVRLDAVFSSLVRNILPSTCTRREERTRSPRSNSSVQGPSSNSILWAVREDLIPPPFASHRPCLGHSVARAALFRRKEKLCGKVRTHTLGRGPFTFLIDPLSFPHLSLSGRQRNQSFSPPQ